MPKHSPLNDESEYFAQLGRMTIAAGIRYLQPRMNTWLEAQLQTLLADAGVAHNGVDKPRRSTKTLQAATSALEALTAAAEDAPKRGRPRVNPSHSMSLVEMIDGRYTKAGVATRLGVAIKSVDYFLKNTGVKQIRLPNPNGDGRSRLATFAVADIEALAVKRGKPKALPPAPSTVRVVPAKDMVDGRYTRVGAARVLGITPVSLHRYTKGMKPLRVRIPGTVKGTMFTWAASDIEALAASRKAASK